MTIGEISMQTPINNFQDILDAMEREPALRDALRQHILGEELIQLPARFVELQIQVNRVQESVNRLEVGQSELREGQNQLREGQNELREEVREMRQDLHRFGGRLSNLTGDNYENHVAEYIHRILRRSMNLHVKVFSTQRDKTSLTKLLDQAESQGIIDTEATDELDQTDLVLTVINSTNYLLAEISITVQQDDVSRAIRRAELLAQATGQNVTPMVIGAREEPNLDTGEVRLILIPEPRQHA